ncbi:MAG: hypothetical protein ABIP75_05235 [Pyrinomonadaceae bacterium]
MTTVIHAIMAPRRRGLMLDIAVFVFSLTLFHLLGRISRSFLDQAETDGTAKLLIGLFFVGLLLLQPWGPLLKRRSFHARHPGFGTGPENLAGCWIAVLVFCYLIMMMIVAGAASTMVTEVVLSGGETIGVLGFFAGLACAIVNVGFFVRFFLPPKKLSRWAFLNSTRAEGIGDISIFLNVIMLQIVWGAVMSSAIFWEVVIKTPLGPPNSLTAILGRFIVIGGVALMVYIPPRVFFLIEQKHRRIAWLTMTIANLPIILRALFATHP